MTDRRNSAGPDRERLRREAWRDALIDVFFVHAESTISVNRRERERDRVRRVILSAARAARRADLLAIDADRRRGLR